MAQRGREESRDEEGEGRRGEGGGGGVQEERVPTLGKGATHLVLEVLGKDSEL